jgi:ATP-binding cassette subfamily C protein
MLFGFLDLLALIIVGLLSYTGSAYLGIAVLPDTFKSYLDFFGFPSEDLGKSLFYLVSLTVLLLVGKSFLSLIFLNRTFHFLANRSAEISENFASGFMNSSYKVRDSISSQEATYAVTRGLHVGEILGGFTVIVSEMTMLILLSTFIILADPFLALTLSLYFIFLVFLSQKKLGSWMRRNSAIFAESTVIGDQTFQDGLALYKELFVSNKLDCILSKFTSFRSQVADSTANMQTIGYIPKLTFEAALIVGTAIVGIQQIVVGSAQNAISALIMFLAAGSRILPSLLRLQSASSSIQSVYGGTEIAFNLIKLIESDRSPDLQIQDFKHLSKLAFVPNIEIENLDFKYESQSDFSIQNLSLTISSGSSIAIVGPSGSGKSTFVDLILGILAPNSGHVLINKINPAIAVQIWPGAIGYVPQMVSFVNGTVRENVAVGVDPSEIDDGNIWECLKMAQLEAIFRDSDLGLETFIGEKGVRLSGGQRQRLGIARALYTNPKLLILDEATSALDAETEKAVAETIHKLMHKVTLIVIAHRIATVQKMDRVIYLENGQFVATGSFSEVRSAVPQFDRQAKLLGL